MQSAALSGNKNYEQRTNLLEGGSMLSSIRRLVHAAGIVLIAVAQLIAIWV